MRQKTKNFAESYCLLNKSYYFCSVLSVTNIHANGKKVTQLNNLSNMLQSEFTMRTQIWCTTEQFEELHKMYTEKHRENLDRQHGLSAKPGYAVSELEHNGGDGK